MRTGENGMARVRWLMWMLAHRFGSGWFSWYDIQEYFPRYTLSPFGGVIHDFEKTRKYATAELYRLYRYGLLKRRKKKEKRRGRPEYEYCISKRGWKYIARHLPYVNVSGSGYPAFM